MNSKKHLDEGTFLLGRNGAVRRVGPTVDWQAEYVQFRPDAERAFRWYCSTGYLQSWGTRIDEGEARRLIANMDEQLRKLEQQDVKESADLSEIALTSISDAALFGELKRRGYDIL